MKIYVETNFVLELALLQEQYASCEKIVVLCETKACTLVLPAFCVAESFESLVRQLNRRKQIANDLEKELRQLSRSEPYKAETTVFRHITSLLVRSVIEEDKRLNEVLERILKFAVVIPLEAGIVSSAAAYRHQYQLEPQDSLVYASVVHHLATAGDVESCFLNRNSRDFDDPVIEETLANQRCKMLFSFENGVNYIEHRLKAS